MNSKFIGRQRDHSNAHLVGPVIAKTIQEGVPVLDIVPGPVHQVQVRINLSENFFFLSAEKDLVSHFSTFLNILFTTLECSLFLPLNKTGSFFFTHTYLFCGSMCMFFRLDHLHRKSFTYSLVFRSNRYATYI